MYKLTRPNYFGVVECVVRLSDNATIPFDLANQDFVEYNKWLSEGGVPLPADE